MKELKLYPNARPVVGQSFVGVERLTVPKQSLSLNEILRRFVRREQLPQVKEGLYETRFGDLEKISRLDIVDQMEIVAELKVKIAEFEARQKVKAASDVQAAEDARVAAAVAAKVDALSASSPKPPAVGGPA